MLTRRWGAKAARWAGVVAVALACASLGAQPARASSEMEPNDAVQADHFVAAGPLVDPIDGALRGYGFAATISQIGEASSIDNFFTETAPAGYRIVVFKVRWAEQGERDYNRDVKGAVIIDGSRTPLPYFDGVIAACVPVGAKQVLFELASAGVAQTFSITERRRVGPQPQVLYRDSAWPDVVSDLTADRVVKARDDKATAPVTVALKRVRLSWFSPGRNITGSDTDTITTPSSPDKAYLIVEGEGYSEAPDDPSTPIFKGFQNVPPADMHLKLPDGSTVSARHAGETTGLLGGAYYFEVPATLGSATLVVGPASVPAQRRVEEADVPTTARLDAATFKLSIPGGDAAQESGGNPDTPTTSVGGAGGEPAATPRTKPATHHSRGGLPVGLAVLVLAVAGLAAGGVVAARRRLRRDGRPDAEPAPPPHPIVSGPAREVGLDALARGPVVSLAGPGAVEAARAALLATTNGEAPLSAVVLAAGETSRLVPPAASVPAWLSVVDDPAVLPEAVEVALVRSARLDGGGDDGQGPRVVVALPASTAGDALRAEVERAVAGGGGRVLVVGGGGVAVEADGTVVLDGVAVRVPVMTEAEAEAALVPAGADDAEPADPPAARRVEVRLLGPLRITVDGREVRVGGRTKSRELLAFLALNRQGASADAAMEALWPGAKPAGPYFRKVLSDLRAIVRDATGFEGDPVERVGQQHRLDASLFDVDLWHFEDALASAAKGDDNAARQAADAYTADLLQGEDLLWAELARGNLRRRALSNLTDLAERRRAAGDLAGALHAAELAVEHDPDTEEHYQRVMALCRDLGRPEAARRTFEALVARLRRLGLSPSDKSRELGGGMSA